MKYKTEFSSIHFEDQSFEADENGIIEADLPSHVVDFYKLEIVDEQEVESDEKKEVQKEEKKSGRKSKKDKQEGE